MEKSSDIAENEHHENCKFECCGEHDEVFTDICVKCPNCGMTKEEQEEHNKEVWTMIDNIENDMITEYEVI